MKRVFNIEPAHKKSLIEILNFSKGEQRMSIETLWRTGSFTVVIDEDEQVVPNWEELDFLSLDSYEYYVDHTYDGQCTEFSGKLVSEEEIAKVERIFWDDGIGYLEEDGWVEDDPMIYFDCPVIVEEITGTSDADMYLFD